jgi:hypothetical protein
MSRSNPTRPQGGAAQTICRPAPRHMREVLGDYLPSLRPGPARPLKETG